MGYNQQKGGSHSDVCSTIKSLESGSLQSTSIPSSPILNGGGGKAHFDSAPPFKNVKGKPGKGSAKRKEDMSSGTHV